MRSSCTKSNQIIGTIYELKDANWKEDNINKSNENIFIKQEKEKEKTIIKETQSSSLSEIQKVHIKFLYSLHLFYEDLENEINGYIKTKSSMNEGYMINHQLVEIFKKQNLNL